MKIAAAIFGHACFIASWVFFSGRAGVLSPEIKGAIPAYLPFAGYGFLLLMSLLESRILGIKIMKSFAGLSPFLTVFAALFGVSVFTGMTLPDPHNFMLRKLEILQGSSFAVFVFITSVAVIFRIWKSGAIRRKDDKNGSTALFSFFLIFYCALSVWFGTANEPTGDETAYLMAAHSLVYDGDLDLKNKFENRDYRNFY